MGTFSARASSAVLWSFLDMFARQGFQFFVSIILARLLSPEDFGVLAMLYVFTSLGALFIDSGFGSALVQRQKTTITEESTVFFFNLGMGATMALILCAAAPWIATFFALPILRELTYLMALNLFIGAFGSIHNTLLSRALNFKTTMKIGGVASILSGILAVILAWKGFGVWSLALQALTASIITVVLLWWWNPWRPAWQFSLRALRPLFKFGGFMLLSGFLDTIYTRLYTVLIGKFFSLRELGYYTRAENTQLLPVSIFLRALGRVAFPAFSAAASDPALLVRGLRKVIKIVMLANVPVMLGLAVVAEPLVITLFGTKWLPAVPFLQVLCLAGSLLPMHVINLNVLMAQGRSDLFFRIEVIKKIVGVIALVVASLHSIMAIAWMRVLLGVFGFFVNAHYSGVLLGYGPWRQLREIAPLGGVSIAMAAVIWLANQSLHLPPAAELVALSVLGAAFYLCACRLLRLVAFDELLAVVAQRKALRSAPTKTSP